MTVHMHQNSSPGRSGLPLPSGLTPDWRSRFFPAIWAVLLPVRLYLRSFPIQRGKGILLRYLVTPLLPPADVEFELGLPAGAKIALRYRETLGLSSLLYGTFELAELKFAEQVLSTGATALDIGANVGIFSVVMAAKAGANGRVFSFEPLPANVVRLKKNLRRNGLADSGVFAVALGQADGEMRLRLAHDPAYPSLHEVEGGLADGTDVQVQVRRLDAVWEELGMPDVAFVKMDVEGAEADVLKGGARFLGTCRPTMLIEANSESQLAALRSILSAYGYRDRQPEGFAPHNHIFFCA